MNVLFIDIDTLRPDHMGCYGYSRDTTPNIDAVCASGVRFDDYYCADAPCLPSRASLISGMFGIRHGAVGHGGTAADRKLTGADRDFSDQVDRNNLVWLFRKAGMKTASVSTFGERHSSYWFNAGFNEIYNVGKGGVESGEEVLPVALEWLDRNGAGGDWFLHVHFWDPHTPYRAPGGFARAFDDSPLDTWITDDIFAEHLKHVGPHSANEINMYDDGVNPKYPRHPGRLQNMEDVKKLIDGYDAGIRYADYLVGEIINKLKAMALYDDMCVIITSDHGENIGELGLYSEHATADYPTCRIPLIVKWPLQDSSHTSTDSTGSPSGPPADTLTSSIRTNDASASSGRSANTSTPCARSADTLTSTGSSSGHSADALTSSRRPADIFTPCARSADAPPPWTRSASAPTLCGRSTDALLCNVDLAPTIAELLGVPAYDDWDGKSFAGAITGGVTENAITDDSRIVLGDSITDDSRIVLGDAITDGPRNARGNAINDDSRIVLGDSITDGPHNASGRESLVISQMAHVCQRSARFGDWLYIRTYHDGYHLFDAEMLFNIKDDPHELHDLKNERPDLCATGAKIILDWHDAMLMKSKGGQDPLWTIIGEGGPYHARGHLNEYLKRLRNTGRAEGAARLEARHGKPK